MMCRILTVTTALTILSMPALAQTGPGDKAAAAQTVTAGTPQDPALQEEVRKVRAFQAEIKARNTPHSGPQVELGKPSTTITYNTASGKSVTVVPTTITERKPVVGYTRIHRVEEGDTLYNLARRNCASVADIQSQNALHDSQIRVGQVLTLPASKCAAKINTASPIRSEQIHSEQVYSGQQHSDQTRSDTGVIRRVMPIQTGISLRPNDIYAVLPKDTLYSIGKRYCVKPDALASFNGLDINTTIQPGQRLRLPGSACLK